MNMISKARYITASRKRNSFINGSSSLDNTSSKFFREDFHDSHQDSVRVKDISYKDAVLLLNSLQSNCQTIKKIEETSDRYEGSKLTKTISFLNRIDVKVEDLDSLAVIHVAGTKGKGSVCAFTESILREHGYKTGFYSSPHMVEVRERIRINGIPISRELFAKHTASAYNRLLVTKSQHDDSMPSYFQFLTVMAFYVFLAEKVDVAVVEVGIGGEFDCTNILRHPIVCGVTSLGIDHERILGSTLAEIAWQKSGIFKAMTPAFTVPQKPDALSVLKVRAAEKKAVLHICSPLESFEKFHFSRTLSLGLSGSVMRENASLALHLSYAWLKHRSSKSLLSSHSVASLTTSNAFPEEVVNLKSDVISPENMLIPMGAPFPLGPPFVRGLSNVTTWHGRNQVIRRSRVTYFLDGAHTVESMQQCSEWFKKQSASEFVHTRHEGAVVSSTPAIARVIICNITGDRDPKRILLPLTALNFDAAIFCPNTPFSSTQSLDCINVASDLASQRQRARDIMSIWRNLYEQNAGPSVQYPDFDDDGPARSSTCECIFLPCIRDALCCSTAGLDDLLSVDIPVLSGTHGSPPDTPVGSPMNSVHFMDDICSSTSLSESDGLPSIQNRLHCNTESNFRSMGSLSRLYSADIIHILITGSLHLVGGALSVIKPYSE